MRDSAETAKDVPSDKPHLLVHETPVAGLTAPEAWERFQSELSEATQPRDAREVSAMNAILNELMRPGTDSDTAFQMVVESAATLTAATASAIALAEDGTFVCRAAHGANAPPVGTILEPRSGLSGLCVRTGQMLCCDDAESDPRVDSSVTRETGVRSISAVPLIKDGRLVGILELLSTGTRAFGDKETDTLQHMAKLAVLTMTRMGGLGGQNRARKARGRWWRVLGLLTLAFMVGFAASRWLAPLLARRW